MGRSAAVLTVLAAVASVAAEDAKPASEQFQFQADVNKLMVSAA